MARNPVDSQSALENESALMDTTTPFELPGLFSEIEGITSKINLPFADENQLISVQAVPDEAVGTSVGELPLNPATSFDTEEYDPNSMDVCEYIQLLERLKLFADPEQKRKEEENEPPEIEDDGNLEEDPVALPELFENVTEGYQEMFSSATENLFSGSVSKDVQEGSDEHKPLYCNALLTVAESLLLVVSFAIRYTLSGSAVNDLLILISLHCINPNLCRTSLHQFQHFFRSIKNPPVYHRYCSHCFLLVDDRATESNSNQE